MYYWPRNQLISEDCEASLFIFKKYYREKQEFRLSSQWEDGDILNNPTAQNEHIYSVNEMAEQIENQLHDSFILSIEISLSLLGLALFVHGNVCGCQSHFSLSESARQRNVPCFN